MNSEHPIHGPEEAELLALLTQVQNVLADAIKSLGGESPPSPESFYLGWAAVSVNRAAEAYLWLRESGRVAASKLLVRPALEATFSGAAVIKKHGFLFRKAYSEWEEEKKMFAQHPAGEGASNKNLEDLKRAFEKIDPAYPIECKRATTRETADAAGLLSMYDGPYRIYCQFTHGALAAAQGHLDDATDAWDTHVVIRCVLVVLDLFQRHTPAEVPNLAPFLKKLRAPK